MKHGYPAIGLPWPPPVEKIHFQVDLKGFVFISNLEGIVAFFRINIIIKASVVAGTNGKTFPCIAYIK